MSLTADRLREVLSYDPETGLFTRRSSGQQAGCVSTHSGYRQIWVDGRTYLAHRLAFLHMDGDWPRDEIDHVNGVRCDNRWKNLRSATRQQNMQNLRDPKPGCSAGVLGATSVGRRFRARIRVNGKAVHLGYFDTPQQSHEAYVRAKRQFHEFGTI